MAKIDEFKEYARRRIVERLRNSKKEDKKSADSKIKSYDGEDGFYSGNEEEYEEFLNTINAEKNQSPEPVKNSDKMGETINVREVLNLVKEKAEAATAMVMEKTEEAMAKLKSDEDRESDATRFEKVSEDITSDINDMRSSIESSLSGSMDQMKDLDKKLVNVAGGFDDLVSNIDSIKNMISEIEKSVQGVEIQTSDSVAHISSESADIKHEIIELKNMTEQIRDIVNGVSKLNDSIFDMKNSQQNTKATLVDLQIAFNRLKKKTVAGVTLISIIVFIIMILQVINLLA